MNRDLRIVMLATDAFGGFGGIAKFNRDFLTALGGLDDVGHLRVLPRTISTPPALPPGIVFERSAAANALSFAWRVFVCLLRHDRINLVICGHRNLLPLAFALARLRGAYLALVGHGVEAWGPSRNRVVNWLSGRIDAFVSVSQVTAVRYGGWSGYEGDVFIMPNCVDLARFRPGPKDAVLMRRYGLGEGKTIMTLGRILSNERYKGFDEVIDLMPRLLARYSGLRYLIVGDGSDRPRLEARVAAMGLGDHVVFTGRVAEADKVAHYNLVDAYVMPSTGEGFGIVLIEALACGLPVVGSSVDGAREALLGGELGRLADPADPDAVFEAIVGALEQGRGDPPRQLEIYSDDAFRARVAVWARQMRDMMAHRASSASRGGSA